ncbi:hypothetical protein E2562_033870 [Oryza meyeriana var. granulata]|uniref:Uncharacterized protein n=1 Tax=Oryza meyeriana var. granulata TaxID=110450 RepID=A0A6G1BPY6_9ORYZ|nr:hypothetical protein E2562_033870 [Oryza meyeriana var. granulata]
MPCNMVFSAAVAAATSCTPPWLHRLHVKRGLSFPSNLCIDEILYRRQGLPPLLSSSSNTKDPPSPPPPKTKQPKQKRQPPQGNNLSLPNSRRSNPAPPQPQLSTVIADLLVTPSSTPLANMPIKSFHKKNHPHPRPEKSSRPNKENKDKAKVKKRRCSERAADPNRERCTRTEVTIIDTSTDGWKAAKLLLHRGDVWKIDDKKDLGISEPVDPTKVKRKAGLVSKIWSDIWKQEEEATLLGNVHASSRDGMKELDGPIQTPKRHITLSTGIDESD